MRRFLLCALAATFMLPAVAQAATISATPSTLSSAISSAQGGDLIQLQAGSYGTISVSGRNPSSTVTIEPAAGASVTAGGVSVSNSSNWDIGGSGISAPGGSLSVSGSSNVAVRNFAFGATNYTGGVIYIVNSSNVLIKGVSAGPIQRADAVMIWPGNPTSLTNRNVTLDGLYIHDLDSDPTVDHQDCVQAASFDGLTIKNSRFINCYAQGLFVNPFSGSTAQNLTIENNFVRIYTPSGRSAASNALNIGNLTGGTMLIRNNTINGNPVVGVDETAATTSARVTGNVFYEVSAFACQTYAGRVDVWDHNVSANACSGATNNAVSSTLTSDFVSATDLHLKAGAFAIGKALAADSPATDIDGDNRGSSADAGADQYASAAPPADTTAPDTSITTGPTDSQSTDAAVAFTATEAGSTFECKLDTGAWVSCTSPKQYTGLAVGSHTISVRATDIAGNTDQSPASVTWSVQSPPPPPDADGDGVPDSQDACQNLAGSRADGCPSPAQSIQLAADLADARSQVSSLSNQLAQANATISDQAVQITAQADEIADLQAQLDAALAARDACGSDLAAMTASRDAWKARADKAEDQVARIRAIAQE